MRERMQFDAAAIIADALNAVQGAGAGNSAIEMCTRVRRCQRGLAKFASQLPPAMIGPLHQLDELLTRLEQDADAGVDLEIVRLELSQRILQLGQLVFSSDAG